MDWSKIAAKFLDAGLRGDQKRLEVMALTFVREAKNEDPEGAAQLASALSKFRQSGALRHIQLNPSPIDAESTMSLLRVEGVPDHLKKPVLEPHTSKMVDRFIRERREASKLLNQGFTPPSKLLLHGLPGTGKTMLSHWIAQELGLNFAVLDLASSISSLLGRTGSNLRKSMDYARATPTLLLLDEFDSVAKKRDDSTDVGELKRVVNVLLKELEDWPDISVLVAATNHVDLLDSAAFRRFDRVVEMPIPSHKQLSDILSQALAGFADKIDKQVVDAIANLAAGSSGATITQVAQATVRRHLVDEEPLEVALLSEARDLLVEDMAPKKRAEVIKSLDEALGNKVPLRVLSEIFDLSISTVHYHVGKRK